MAANDDSSWDGHPQSSWVSLRPSYNMLALYAILATGGVVRLVSDMGYWPLSAAFLVVVGVAIVIQPTQIDLDRDGMIVVRPVGKRYYPATELAVQEDSKRVTITRHPKRRAVLTLVKRPSHLRRKYRWQPSHVQNPAETVRALLHHDQEASGT